MIFLGIPVGILSVSAILGGIVTRSRRNAGLSWLIATLAAMLVWGWVFSLHFHAEDGFSIGNTIFQLKFVLDSISLPYMMASASLLTLVMITAPSRLDPDSGVSLWLWSSYLVITLITLVTSAAFGIWTVILCWMIFDIFDFFLALFASAETKLVRSIMSAMAIRLTGTFLAAISFAISTMPLQEGASLNALEAGNEAVLLLACGLRMGIVPIHQPTLELPRFQSGMGTIVRLSSLITALVVINRIETSSITQEFYIALSLFISIAAIIGSLGWILAKDAVSGKEFFAIAISCMAFLSAIRFEKNASIALGVGMIFAGAPLFLYNVRNRFLNLLFFVLWIMLSGVPFTPNALGWFGFFYFPPYPEDFIMYISFVLILAGYLFHFQAAGQEETHALDRWVKTIYPFGFVFMIAAWALTAGFNWQFYQEIGEPTLSVSALAIALLIWRGIPVLAARPRFQSMTSWFHVGIQKFWTAVRWLMNLEWLFPAWRFLSQIIDKILQFVTRLFERRGGILWELLTLFIILILILARGSE